MLKYVIKNNGSEELFELGKMIRSIELAFKDRDRQYNDNIIDFLAVKASSNFETDIKSEKISSKNISKSIDTVLRLGGYEDVADSYLNYRHNKYISDSNTLIDYKKLVNDYLDESDWRVKENSTVTHTLGGLILSNSGAVTASYWLSEVYDEEIAEAHHNADIHIHDLSMLSGYCFTGDTRIKTVDGKNPTFKELVDSGIKSVKVFSYDLNENKVVIADAINPRITRQVNKLIEVTLTTGASILCTEDHPFMMRDGSFKKAKDLKSNDSLMALYLYDKGKYVGINKAWNSENNRMYLHRWVAENYIVHRKLLDNEVVHHKDGNKHNNLPENLEVMLSSEHRAIEFINTMKSDKWKLANRTRLAEYNRSEEKRNR